MADDSELRESPHTSVEWKIKTFLDLPTEVNYFLNSPRFSLSDAKWFLQIFPNGRTSNNGRPGWISLYLRKEYCTTEYRVAFRLGMKKADGTVFAAFDREETYGLEDKGWGRVQVVKRSDLPSLNNAGDIGGWGWPTFLTTTPDPDTLTPDGVLTVFCNARIVDAPLLTTTTNTARTVKAASQNQSITIVEAASQTSDEKLLVSLSKDFCSLYESKTNTDCILRVGETKFPVHRAILSARSPVFAAMFRHVLSENRSGVVDIPGVEAAVLNDVLQYMYSGRISGITPDSVVPMYIMADKYVMVDLKDVCVDFLMHNLTIENVCEIAILAQKYEEIELEGKIVQFIDENYEKLEKSEEWRLFKNTKPLHANKLLCSAYAASRRLQFSK